MAVTTGYYFPKLDIMSVPPKTETKPVYGRVIAARRAYLQKSAMHIENTYSPLLYQKLLYRIEGGKKHPLELDLKTFDALLKALEWTTQEFSRETGLEVPQSFQGSGPDPLERFAPPETDWTHFHVMHSASAGTGEIEFLDEDEIVSIPTQKLRARGARREDVMVVKVNGNCLVSQNLRTSRRSIAHGDYVFVHMGAAAQAGDIVCVWDDQDSQLMLKFATEQQDPDHPDEITFYDAKGRSYIRNIADVKYRGIAFWKSGEL